MTKNLHNAEALTKLKDLIKEVSVCMFATIDEDNNIYSRPMATIETDNDGNIWFFTNEYSEKVQDISKVETVYLSYSHPGKNTYLHVKGQSSIVTDREKLKEKWSPIVKAWFPEGVDDPKLCLLKVEPEQASYWDNSSNKLVNFLNILKAIGTGKTYDKGDVGTLNV